MDIVRAQNSHMTEYLSNDTFIAYSVVKEEFSLQQNGEFLYLHMPSFCILIVHWMCRMVYQVNGMVQSDGFIIYPE